MKAGLALATFGACLVLVACGGGDDADRPTVPDYAGELAGAPQRLAALHEQANELLDGGPQAFERRIAELRGFGVVVNKWASWCGPCRAEFPHFQSLAAELGTEVAFLGVDSNDSKAAAETFLRDYPVPYPSYVDPDEEIAELLEAPVAFPATAFYDSDGELVHVKQGQYASEAELARDIRRYAK